MMKVRYPWPGGKEVGRIRNVSRALNRMWKIGSNSHTRNFLGIRKKNGDEKAKKEGKKRKPLLLQVWGGGKDGTSLR